MRKSEINNDNSLLINLGYKPVLSRQLSLVYLIAFGLNYLQPIGPAVIFGGLISTSGGSVLLPYLLAFMGMFFTLCSYAILSKKFPIADSLYSYIYHVMGHRIAFIAGWLLMLDYLLIPTITLASATHYITATMPRLNYEIIFGVLTITMGLINIIGIKVTAKISLLVLLVQLLAVFSLIALCAVWIVNFHKESLFSFAPFKFSDTSSLLSASSLAIFGYLGFDAISTLAEESKKPSKNIPKAMFICLFLGCLVACLIGYLGVLVIPNWKELFAQNTDWENSTLFQISTLVGGTNFSSIFIFTFVLSMIATNIVGTTAAARLLFSMGRNGALKFSFFYKVHERWKTPWYNVVLLGVVCFIVGSLRSVDQIAELINYGAISSFTLLNLGAVVFLLKQKKAKNLCVMVLPLIGIVIMSTIFLHIQKITMIFGTLWLFLGIILMFFIYRRAVATPSNQ